MHVSLHVHLGRRLKRVTRLLARASRWSVSEWRVLLTALPLVLFVRAALWTTTFTRVHALLTRNGTGTGGLEANEVDEWSRAVARASRLLPGATCLTQALALQRLLQRQGEASCIQIGFLHDGAVRGHAWLVNRGRVVIGGKSSANFTITMELESQESGVSPFLG